MTTKNNTALDRRVYLIGDSGAIADVDSSTRALLVKVSGDKLNEIISAINDSTYKVSDNLSEVYVMSVSRNSRHVIAYRVPAGKRLYLLWASACATSSTNLALAIRNASGSDLMHIVGNQYKNAILNPSRPIVLDEGYHVTYHSDGTVNAYFSLYGYLESK